MKRRKRGMSFLVLGCLLLSLSGGFVHAQIERWIYQDSESGVANSIIYGSDNKTYTAGYIMPSGSDTSDFYVVGLDSMGSPLWSYNYNGSASNNDEAYAVVYGNDDNLYAAGYSIEDGTDKDFTTISVDNTGNENWVYTYDGAASSDDRANSLVYGDDGNIYAAGYSVESGSDQDFTVISVDNIGNENWVYTYDGAVSSNDGANSLVYGADGNIYAVGYSVESGSYKDFTVISINPTTGDSNWVYTYDGVSSRHDEAHSIVYGDDGNLYVAGYSTSGYKKFTVISLDTSGNQRWVYIIDIADTRDEEAYSVIYGADNNIYAAGYVWILNKYNDFAVIKIDTLGNEKWVYTYNGTGSRNDGANAIVYGADDNIYTVGLTRTGSGATSQDFSVISLDTLGTETWLYTYNGVMDDADVAHSIVYGDDGYLYVAGYSDVEAFTVISLDPATKPAMWYNPVFLMVMIDTGETAERTLKIANVGGEGCIPLEWSISERPPVEWLSEDSTSGFLNAGDTVSITITFDATNLEAGIYYDTLEITSNDQDNPSMDVSVKLTVQIPGVQEYPQIHQDDRCELLSSFFNNTISIQFTRPSDTPCEVTLHNVLGACVYKTVLPSTLARVDLGDKSIDQLSLGIYFLSVSRSEKVYPVMKLVKF
jgi:lipopolysaccharide export LptBFGC system permease protein LptF